MMEEVAAAVVRLDDNRRARRNSRSGAWGLSLGGPRKRATCGTSRCRASSCSLALTSVRAVSSSSRSHVVPACLPTPFALPSLACCALHATRAIDPSDCRSVHLQSIAYSVWLAICHLPIG